MKLFMMGLFLVICLPSFASDEKWVNIVTTADSTESDDPSRLALERCFNALLNYAQSCNDEGGHLIVADEDGCLVTESSDRFATAAAKVQCN